MSLLDISGLSVRYGQITALDDVSINVERGEAVALLGANGAGKSTLMKAIVGLIRPAAGTICFNGADLAPIDTAARARNGLGYSPEGRRVFPGLTVRENLEVASTAARSVTHARCEEVYTLFPGLREKENALGWQLSGGQQQMLAIGRALMSQPQLVLLDEPSLGLSPLLTNEVLDQVRRVVATGTAVLIAEQNVAKALAVTDRAYVLQVGRIVEAGASAALKDSPRIREAFLGG